MRFYVDDSQENAMYDMILGWDFLSELQIYLCSSDFTTRGNGGVHKGCVNPRKDVNKGYVKTPIK